MPAVEWIVVVEDAASEAAVRRIVRECAPGWVIYLVQNCGGSARIRAGRDRYLNASHVSPHLILIDLDDYECPLSLMDAWGLRSILPRLVVRIAVREVESWILGDRCGVAALLQVPMVRVPQQPERERDPKGALIQIARRSRSRRLVAELCPAHRSSASQGPLYNERMTEFIAKHWNLRAAQAVVPSLDRTCRRIEELAGAERHDRAHFPDHQLGLRRANDPLGRKVRPHAAAGGLPPPGRLRDHRHPRRIPDACLAAAGGRHPRPCAALAHGGLSRRHRGHARAAAHWWDEERSSRRPYRFYFCQLEAIETQIWYVEAPAEFRQGVNVPGDGGAFQRLCNKMATGTGKTTVMAMIVAWQVLNSLTYPRRREFSRAVLVVAPGLTVKDRLRVLYPGEPGNYYDEFDLVPFGVAAPEAEPDGSPGRELAHADAAEGSRPLGREEGRGERRGLHAPRAGQAGAAART